ncbi:MAG: VWA domain-containing protein [Myxococcales bacterium]|nr:VWA domain-containing protein [Myxococcales bacterium]
MSKLQEVSIVAARPLPVILLADVSGSMAAAGKIDSLNQAVREMVAAFAEEDRSRAIITVGVITFGSGGAKLHQPLCPAHEMTWQGLAAAGNTPLGAALNLATELMEDQAQIPSRAYRPTVVLVSDGQPNDEWEEPLARLHSSPRASKAERFALAIGDDADCEMLQRFLGSPEARVFRAHEARQIKQFFRWVTMTVTTRSRSINPNLLAALEDLDY